MTKLIEYKRKDHLGEIFQSLDVKFSFLKERDSSYEQITNPGKCRDFLGDVLWSKNKKMPVDIWGFRYSHEKDPFDEDFLKLSLKFPKGKGALENFKNNLSLLHEKEKEAGVPLTTVLDTQEKDTLIVIADAIWQKTPWRLSLYTFYLKVISYPSIKQLDYPECDYITQLDKKTETTLLSHVKDEEEAFFLPTLDSNHEHAGFVATIRGENGKESKRIFGGK